MIPIIAAVENQGAELAFFVFGGAAFLGLSLVMLWFVHENAYRLILLALLTAVVGIGFGAFLPNAAFVGAEILMKIAFIMALGGVGSLLLSANASSTAIIGKKRKGSEDAD
jgi:hypothetical protein